MKHVDICLEDGQYLNIKYHETCRYMFRGWTISKHKIS